MRRLALALGLAIAATAVVAEEPVYTWVDANGVRHYAQTPPVGVKYETRGIKDRQLGSGAPDAPAAPTRTPEEVMACDRARVALQQLNATTVPMMDKDGDGKPEPLTPEERAQQIRLSEQAVAAYCPQANG